jgi:diguanylate cyclase (GGDEF)-like protein/putative nucleotidyltransferase with HDIG domain
VPHRSARKRAWLSTGIRTVVAWTAAAGAAAFLKQRTARDEDAHEVVDRDIDRLYRDSLDEKAQLEKTLERERELARRDPLTGCLNHAVVLEELRSALRQEGARTLSVALVDVDGLKATNDLYGHQVGDAALISVATALQQDGAIVGRYGGDEFVVVLPGVDRDQAERYREVVQGVLAAVQLTSPEGVVDVPVVASMGLATYPEEGHTSEELLKLADNAMYAERRRPAPGRVAALRFESERVAKLLGDIVPLLTSKGTREEKLETLAQHLSVGTGYDAVNIEVAGIRSGQKAEWENTFVRAPREWVDAWQEEQRRASEHPLSKFLDETRQPLFVPDISIDERLTEGERQLLTTAGLKAALVVPMIWQDQLVGMLSVVSKSDGTFGAWDAQFLTAIATHVTAIVFMTDLVEELQEASKYLSEAHAETVLMLAAAAEAYDDGTGSHLMRVRTITEALAKELGYSDHDIWRLGLAAVLHDVGKIRVPIAVLTSPQGLTQAEWGEMRRHTVWGAELLRGRRGFELASQVAHSHHERWDGKGYPDGLAGEEIPEAAAIVSVADSFDAMTSTRPYRAQRPASEALVEINACSGVQFSPAVVAALNRLAERGALAEHDEHHEAEAA